MSKIAESKNEYNDLIMLFGFSLNPRESKEEIKQYIYEIYAQHPNSYPPNVLRNRFVAVYSIYKNCIEKNIDIGIDMQMSEFESLICLTFDIIKEIEDEEMKKYGLYIPTIQTAVKNAKESLRVMEEGDIKKFKRNYQRYISSFRALSKLYTQLIKGKDIGYFVNHPTIVGVEYICDEVETIIQSPVSMVLAKTGRDLVSKIRIIGCNTELKKLIKS